MILVNAEPADRAAAIAGALATITMASGDFTLSDGSVSGDRKITVASKTGQSVSASGTYNHLCLVSATDLLVVTTAAASKSLNNGDTVDVVAWDFEINKPT
jgi:hypothetical protein